SSIGWRSHRRTPIHGRARAQTNNFTAQLSVPANPVENSQGFRRGRAEIGCPGRANSCRALAAWRYWAVDVASVLVAARGMIGVLSFAAGGELVAALSFAAFGTITITERVLVLVRPVGSVAT